MVCVGVGVGRVRPQDVNLGGFIFLFLVTFYPIFCATYSNIVIVLVNLGFPSDFVSHC